MFAGQRDDAFFADLGSIFDLLGLRPINGAHVAPLPAGGGVDALFAGASLAAVVRSRSLLTRSEDWEAVALVHGAVCRDMRPAHALGRGPLRVCALGAAISLAALVFWAVTVPKMSVR